MVSALLAVGAALSVGVADVCSESDRWAAGEPASADAVRLSGWRNERVRVRLAVSPSASADGLRLSATDLRGPGGARIAADRVAARGVGGGAWFTVSVPAGAAPGAYAGAFVLRTPAGAERRLPVELKVLPHPALPAAKDRRRPGPCGTAAARFPVETAWLALCAAAREDDAFLARAAAVTPDTFVGREILDDALEDWEKIRILREAKAMSAPLKCALAEFDPEPMRRAEEHVHLASVAAVRRELDRSADDPAVDAQVAGWEAGGRAKTLDWFRREFYGYAPGRPADERLTDEGVELAGGKIRIPVYCKLPEGASAGNPAPVFVLIDHFNGTYYPGGRWHFPDTPTNSIVSHGYAFVNFNVNDVSPNVYNQTWSNGVFQVYGLGKPDDWGTISAWAWGVSRVVDWIETRPELDVRRIAVIGHSRGGKTALWAGVQDPRIALAVPNGSGTGGARLLRMNLPDAEQLAWMLEPSHGISFWYCPNAQKHAKTERTLPYDADDLLRLMAPRLVYVSSGSEDVWAGPEGEFESARRASDLWRRYGLPGLSAERFPAPGEWSHEGCVGHHLHDGPHGLTPWDWERVLEFADRHMKGIGRK